MTDSMNSLVSVVIPTYNHARFLGRALQSVLDQTYTNWEVTVIDNHSSDNTDEVMTSFTDSRITYLKIHNNGVIAASRNAGIRVAKGDWIAFLDSDDFWYPEKLAFCMKKIESSYDLVCHGEYWVKVKNGSRQLRKVIYGPESRATFEKLLYEGNCISTSAVVVRRQSLLNVSGFNENKQMVTAEDYHLWLNLAKSEVRMGFLDEILGEYTIHAGNASKEALKNMCAIRYVFEEIYGKLNKHTFFMRVIACRRRAIIDYGGARVLQANQEHLKAIPWFLKSIVRWPFNIKFYAALVLNILGSN